MILLPVLLPQAIWTRFRTPRLPEALGDHQSAEDAELTLFGIGESTIVGVGVERMEQALTAQTAVALAAKLEQTVGWRCFGRNGARLSDILAEFKQLPVARFDAIVVSLGVNDVTGLTSLLRWSQQVLDLVLKLKQRYQVPVYFCAVPPMHLFTALPQPLGFVLGVRAKMLNQVLARTAQAVDNFHFVSPQIRTDRNFLAEDGYHPSSNGYSYLGQQLADAIYPHLINQIAAAPAATQVALPADHKGSS